MDHHIGLEYKHNTKLLLNCIFTDSSINKLSATL